VKETYQAVVQGIRQSCKVEPDVERAVGRKRDLQSHFCQTAEDIVTLDPKVNLQSELIKR
jgi:hypothetical protein